MFGGKSEHDIQLLFGGAVYGGGVQAPDPVGPLAQGFLHQFLAALLPQYAELRERDDANVGQAGQFRPGVEDAVKSVETDCGVDIGQTSG